MKQETESKTEDTAPFNDSSVVASAHECLLLDYISATTWSKNDINAVNSQPEGKD